MKTSVQISTYNHLGHYVYFCKRLGIYGVYLIRTVTLKLICWDLYIALKSI